MGHSQQHASAISIWRMLIEEVGGLWNISRMLIKASHLSPSHPFLYMREHFSGGGLWLIANFQQNSRSKYRTRNQYDWGLRYRAPDFLGQKGCSLLSEYNSDKRTACGAQGVLHHNGFIVLRGRKGEDLSAELLFAINQSKDFDGTSHGSKKHVQLSDQANDCL